MLGFIVQETHAILSDMRTMSARIEHERERQKERVRRRKEEKKAKREEHFGQAQELLGQLDEAADLSVWRHMLFFQGHEFKVKVCL